MKACDCVTTPVQNWAALVPTAHTKLRRLGSGIAKVGFALPCGSHVLKVSLSGPHDSQIRDEVAVWLAVQGTAIVAELTAIIAYDPAHEWIVVERADMQWPTTVSAQEQIRRWRVFTERMSAYGFVDLQRVGTNCGLRQGTGRLVMVDYGIAGHFDRATGKRSFDPNHGRKQRKAARKAAWAAAHPRPQAQAAVAAGDWQFLLDGMALCRHCGAERRQNDDLRGHQQRHHGGA